MRQGEIAVYETSDTTRKMQKSLNPRPKGPSYTWFLYLAEIEKLITATETDTGEVDLLLAASDMLVDLN
jgi:hypothetical protein